MLQGGLWYWEKHCVSTAFVYKQMGVPAAWQISLSLNAPASVFAVAIYFAVDGPHWIGYVGFESLFIVCVLALWVAIGSWLDSRSSTPREMSPVLTKQLIIGRLALRILMIEMGIFFLFSALALHAPYFGARVSRFLLLAWGVFLILTPGVAFVRWSREGHPRRLGG